MSEKNKEIPPELKERQREGFKQEWRKELRKAVPAKDRMKIPLQKMPAGKEQPHQRAHDGINHQPGLVRQHGDGQQELP